MAMDITLFEKQTTTEFIKSNKFFMQSIPAHVLCKHGFASVESFPCSIDNFAEILYISPTHNTGVRNFRIIKTVSIFA